MGRRIIDLTTAVTLTGEEFLAVDDGSADGTTQKAVLSDLLNAGKIKYFRVATSNSDIAGMVQEAVDSITGKETELFLISINNGATFGAIGLKINNDYAVAIGFGYFMNNPVYVRKTSGNWNAPLYLGSTNNT